MSFFARTTFRAVSVRAAPRAFSTGFVARKSATETVKETLKTVDKAISGKIVDGIEVGGTSHLWLIISTQRAMITQYRGTC